MVLALLDSVGVITWWRQSKSSWNVVY